MSGARMPHVALINPNTSSATTERMLAIARAHGSPSLEITGLTAQFGVSLITNAAELAVASDAVVDLARDLDPSVDAVIVAAFGDPGLDRLRKLHPMPIVGIGEASLLEAAAGGRRFAVVTTTPDLEASIDQMVAELHLADGYAGVVLTREEPRALMLLPDRLETALAAAITTAISVHGVDVVIIGGGPLAAAAKALTGYFSIPIIEPIPAAVRWISRDIAVG
jgi:Asp/Glu/hydantoin racemase